LPFPTRSSCAPTRSSNKVQFAALHMSLNGTSRTSGEVRLESAKWTKVDIDELAIADGHTQNDEAIWRAVWHTEARGQPIAIAPSSGE
jgi:hypothetical protein